MAASRVSRCLLSQILTNCSKTRACQAALLQRHHQNQRSRPISTARCLSKENKDESDTKNLTKDSSVESTQKSKDVIQPSDKQSAVADAKEQSELTEATAEASSSDSDSDSSSSDSDSDSSSSDSDVEASARLRVDPGLEKAAADVAKVLPGDKAQTKAELLAKVLSKMKQPQASQDTVHTIRAKSRKAARSVKKDPKDLVKSTTFKASPDPAPQEDRRKRGRKGARSLIKDPKDLVKTTKYTQYRASELSQKPASQKDRGEQRKEIKPELTEAEIEQRDKKRRSLVEKMNTNPIAKKLLESQEGDTQRQKSRRARMFEEIDRSRTISDDKRGQQDNMPARSPVQRERRRKEARPEPRPELTEAEREQRDEKRRAIVEKMNSYQMADDDDTGRQGRMSRRFEEKDSDRRISDVTQRKQDDLPPIPDREKPIQSAFEGVPLGIFSEKPSTETTPTVTSRRQLYDILQEEAADKLYAYPPRNAWQEQIQWTRQGKLWTFPIDNEAGWDEEKGVSFQEHVFLERQLRDFPTRGPIRHFMELVTVALSKNPHMTVHEKHEHIDWFRQYFLAKENVLVGPLGDMGKFKDSPQSTST